MIVKILNESDFKGNFAIEWWYMRHKFRHDCNSASSVKKECLGDKLLRLDFFYVDWNDF